MLRNDISHKRQLRKLQNAKKLTGDEDSKRIKEAHKSGADHAELATLRDDESMHNLLSGDQIEELQSRHLIKKAELYLVPKPPFDNGLSGKFDNGLSGDWEESDVTGRWRLTLPAQAELMSAIYGHL